MRNLFLAGMIVMGVAAGSSSAMAADCPATGCVRAKISEIVLNSGGGYILTEANVPVCINPATQQPPASDWNAKAAFLNSTELTEEGLRRITSALLAAQLAGRPVALHTAYRGDVCYLSGISIWITN